MSQALDPAMLHDDIQSKIHGWRRRIFGRMLTAWGHVLNDPLAVAEGAMEQLAGELELRGVVSWRKPHHSRRGGREWLSGGVLHANRPDTG